MQSAELIRYIENPQLLDRESIARLQKLADDFPYFQPAHMLLSMASRKWDASVYQQSLKRTAIVVTNREHLFNLVNYFDALETIAEPAKDAAIEKTPEPVKEELKPVAEQPEITVQVVEPEAKVEQPEESAPALTAEESFEKEIGKQVVNSFVEKELLKTPELHHPQPKKEPGSFSDWLLLMKKNNGQPLSQTEIPVKPARKEQPEKEASKNTVPAETDEGTQQKKQKHRALIDKIIENNPGLIRNKEEQKFFAADSKAKESLRENEHLVTETLAKIYALQGNVNKAVRAYEILSLKYPQKSAYFATLIQQLKNNQ